jgi:DNA replication protein DnaC
MSELVMERVMDNLTRLRCSRIQELLPGMVEEAQAGNQTYLGFLDRLLQEEVTAKEDRRVRTSLKIAGLPFD